MLNTTTEYTDYTRNRLRQEFAPIHDIALRWGDEYRQDGSPPVPTSIAGKIIDGTGPSQMGAPTPDASPDVALFGQCVAKLPAIKRIVINVEYAECRGWPKAEKLRHISRRHKIRMSPTGWDRNLAAAREGISTAFQILLERQLEI
jgi:hypothetical protein